MIDKDKILIIDDEQVILDAVTKIASSENLEVDSVTNAVDGINKISNKSYSLILCDIMMPEFNGFQLLDELYNRKNKTPVIMITGYSTVENAVNSLNKGALDFIPKPFTFEELTSSISRGLNYNRVVQKLERSRKSGSDETVLFVSCPPKYKRLGHISWMNLESEGLAVVGVSDLFLETINEVEKIELSEIEDIIIQGNSCAKFETSDGLIHTCLAPLGGRIIERNEKLLSEPSLLEKDPYFQGWLYKIIPSDIEYETKYLITGGSDIL